MTTALTAPIDLSAPIAPPSVEDVKKNPQTALLLAETAERLRQMVVEKSELVDQWRDHCEAVKRHNTAVLGRDELFLVKDGGQKLRCVKVPVRLTLEEGHLYEVQGKWNVTAVGYTKLNQIAGVSLVQPETIVVDGREQVNPYLEMHPQKPGVLLRVHCRVLSIGRNATGQPCVVDYRLKFDPNLYLLQSLKKLQAGKATWAGEKGNRHKVEAVQLIEAVDDMLLSEFDARRSELKGWGYLPFAAVGDDFLGVAFNLRHPEVRNLMGDQVNLVGFAERRAQTIARRNALRHNAALGVTTVTVQVTAESGNGDFKKVTGAYADVMVYGWPPDNRSIQEVASMILAGTKGQGVGTRADVVVDEDADPDDGDSGDEVSEGEVSEVAATAQPAPAPKTAAPKLEVVKDAPTMTVPPHGVAQAVKSMGGPKDDFRGDEDDVAMFDDNN